MEPIKKTPIEIAEALFIRHTHAELIVMDNDPNQIVYREGSIISLLKELGYPEPDWDGYAELVRRANSFKRDSTN